MIQRLATLLITLYISISLQAQDKKKPGFTKEEFRATRSISHAKSRNNARRGH